MATERLQRGALSSAKSALATKASLLPECAAQKNSGAGCLRCFTFAERLFGQIKGEIVRVDDGIQATAVDAGDLEADGDALGAR